MTRVEEIYQQVKRLSPEERDEFDLLLMQEASAPDLSPEWRAEIDRRVDAWKAGKGGSRSWDDLEGEYAAMKERKHTSTHP